MIFLSGWWRKEQSGGYICLHFWKVTNKGIQLTCFDTKTLRYEQGNPTDLLDV